MTFHWPLHYLETVKRPGKRYFWRAVIQEDYVFWVLATSWLSPTPLLHAGALFFLLLSFWSIYELGYAENDWAAYNLEGGLGKVPEGAYTKRRPPEWAPWLWALILALPGLLLLGYTVEAAEWAEFHVLTSCGWLLLLGVTRLCYLLYNHIAPVKRVFVYPVLQICRTFGVLIVTTTNAIGLILLTAHVFARSVPYLRYRLDTAAAPGRWPGTPGALVRLCVFVLLWLSLAMIRHDATLLIAPQALVIFLWCLFRARKELPRVARVLRPS